MTDPVILPLQDDGAFFSAGNATSLPFGGDAQTGQRRQRSQKNAEKTAFLCKAHKDRKRKRTKKLCFFRTI